MNLCMMTVCGIKENSLVFFLVGMEAHLAFSVYMLHLIFNSMHSVCLLATGFGWWNNLLWLGLPG